MTDRATLDWGPGAVLGDRYELLQRAGSGGYAEVWRARDRRLGRDVAVKLLSGPAAADPMQRQRIEREARALAALAHPNIVRVFDYDEEPRPSAPPVPYLVMEYVQGPNLAEHLAAAGPSSPEEAVDLVGRVLDGIEQAHAIGIVHGDLKPANVLLDTSGEPKVGDFGVARVLAEETGNTIPVATPAYAPPEVLQGARPTAASDVYSAACIAYETLTGDRPFAGTTLWETTRQHIEDEAPSLRDALTEDGLDALDATIRRALSKRSEDRYQSAASFATALRAAVAPATAPPGTLPMESTVALEAADVDTAEHEPVAETMRVAPEVTQTVAVRRPPRRLRPARTLRWLWAIPPGLVIAIVAVLILAGMRGQANATVRVPKLTELSIQQARVVATRSGFTLREKEVEGPGKAGIVLHQTPGSNELRKRGTPIDVEVSKGKTQVTVPNVDGKSVDDATRILTDAKLTVSKETATYSLETDKPFGTVLGTEPHPAGATVDAGTTVRLVISARQESPQREKPAPPRRGSGRGQSTEDD